MKLEVAAQIVKAVTTMINSLLIENRLIAEYWS